MVTLAGMPIDADLDAPALGHRITRVGDQVHNGLAQIVRVRLDPSILMIDLAVQLAVFPDQGPEQGHHAIDRFGDRDHLFLRTVAPGEDEQLPRHTGRRIRRLQHLCQAGLRRLAVFRFFGS